MEGEVQSGPSANRRVLWLLGCDPLGGQFEQIPGECSPGTAGFNDTIITVLDPQQELNNEENLYQFLFLREAAALHHKA